ncbi:galactose oxidase [Apiospora kogelbergensis]|uniref:Galactose oxidase n=1 Tax=Apiospora kogelbergensis TaxID=1337665 RepID=A0AAW0RD66_9PEZI
MCVLAPRLLLLTLLVATRSSVAVITPQTRPRALPSSQIQELSGAESHWETLPSLPLGPRQEDSVAALGTDVYILAGITSAAPNATAYPSLHLVQAYCTKSRAWRRVADVPMPLNHAHLAAAGAGKLYILGSLTGDGPFTPTGVGYVYDAGADAWTRLSGGDLPTGLERGAGAVGVWRDRFIMVAGGMVYNNPFTGIQNTVADVSVFDTQMGVWLPRGDWPALPDGGRDHAGGAVVGDTMYVVGGRRNGGINVKGDVFALDLGASPQARRWVAKAGMLTPRGGLMAAAVDGKIYTFGGEGLETQGAGPSGVFDDVEVYDTETDSWEKLPAWPAPRHGTGAAVVAGKIYMPGGANMTGPGATSVVDAFSP